MQFRRPAMRDGSVSGSVCGDAEDRRRAWRSLFRSVSTNLEVRRPLLGWPRLGLARGFVFGRAVLAEVLVVSEGIVPRAGSSSQHTVCSYGDEGEVTQPSDGDRPDQIGAQANAPGVDLCDVQRVGRTFWFRRGALCGSYSSSPGTVTRPRDRIEVRGDLVSPRSRGLVAQSRAKHWRSSVAAPQSAP
jgi:hypothetical protein